MTNKMKGLLILIQFNSILYGQLDTLNKNIPDTTRFSCYCEDIINPTGMIITENYISDEGYLYTKLKFNNKSAFNKDNVVNEENYFDLYRISGDSIFFRKGGLDTFSNPISSKEFFFGSFSAKDTVSNKIETSSYLGNKITKVIRTENKYYHPDKYKYIYTFYLERTPELNYPLIDRLSFLPNGLIIGYRFCNTSNKFECRKLL